MIDRLHKFHRLSHAGQKIIFKTVEILDCNGYLRLCGVIGNFLHGVDAPLKFIIGRAFAGEFTDG